MKLTQLIKNSKSILIVCHVRPDGDTLGSGLAVYTLMQALKKSVDIVADSEIPPQYCFMPNIDKVNVQENKKYDTTIVVDCADADRMGKFADYAKSTLSISIDHHVTNDRFCKHNEVNPTASSTCEVVFDILENEKLFAVNSVLNSAQKKEIATCLCTGLSTDTGHFMHSSVNEKVMNVASKLSKLGANIHNIANAIYRSDSKVRLQLLGQVLSSLRFFDDDKICIMSMHLSDFEKFNASPMNTEGFINFGLSIKTTLVAVSITQHKQNEYKVSFRSKGIDVSKVAGVFGGGGHVRAAGCTICGYYEDVVDKVVKSVRDFM